MKKWIITYIEPNHGLVQQEVEGFHITEAIGRCSYSQSYIVKIEVLPFKLY